MATIIDQIMSQAQVFASAWSLVGGRFDKGDEMANAEAQKAELRAMIERAVPRAVWIGFDLASGSDMTVEGLLLADEQASAQGASEVPRRVSFSGFVQRVNGQPVGLDWTEPSEGAPE